MSIFGVHHHPPLRAEGHLPSFDGAIGWLNSAPPHRQTFAARSFDFWTLTCINWLRTEPYVRTWSQARPRGPTYRPPARLAQEPPRPRR
jgi:hypothetical protein